MPMDPPTARAELWRCVRETRGRDAPTVCAICLERYDERSEVVVLSCLHAYCVDCVARWTEQSDRCPECKTRIAWCQTPGGAAAGAAAAAES